MKRNLFDELNEGFDALKNERQGKITLRKHAIEISELPALTSVELVRLREALHLSQAVFARYLRTNKRTLENWEQGRAKPNAQATILIRMVEKYPDTLQRLQGLEGTSIY
ncbi:MAG: helix-turn-helix domain-containing protein [Pseudohongiellaceae bacterium]